MTTTKKPTCIADLLDHARIAIGAHHEVAPVALRQSVALLRAALPFQLPIPILTGSSPDVEIEREDSREPYAGILVRWYSELLTHPVCRIEVVMDVLGEIRSAVDTWFWNLVERQDRIAPPFRKRNHAVSDLTDAAMMKWLSAITLAQLSALATRWDDSRRANNKPGVLKELGLTPRSMLTLSDADMVTLGLLERLETEEKERSAELWRFLQADDIGRNVEHIVPEVGAAFVASSSKQ